MFVWIKKQQWCVFLDNGQRKARSLRGSGDLA